MLMKIIIPIVILLPAILLLGSCSKSDGNLDNKNNPVVITTDTTKNPPAPTYSLVRSDEFDGPDIETTKWNFELGSLGVNNEKEYYKKENASIQDCNLVISAKAENVIGFPYTSARMNTLN